MNLNATDPKGQAIASQYDPLDRMTFAGYTAAGASSYPVDDQLQL